MATNTTNKRQKLPTQRIGKAAVGRTLLILVENLITCYMSAECMRTTMRAVYIYLHCPDILINDCLNTQVFSILKNEIDQSYERSQKARERAALRKAAREAAALASLQNSADAPITPICDEGDGGYSLEQTLSESAECAPISENPVSTEQTPRSAAPVSDEIIPALSAPVNDDNQTPDEAKSSSHKPVKKRRPARDPDEPAFTYRPPAQKPPKAYVITEEDEVEPYDPYGVRKAFEMQKVPRLVRSNLW